MDRYERAVAFMAERKGNQRLLIEVAAQHPLEEDGSPNEEFTARLDRGAELYRQYRDRSFEVEIYVPGSRHMHEGQPDPVSLSEAGTAYLTTAKIPSDILHGDDLNQRYKGDLGVYGSADECFVTASYFRDGQFGLLASVLSPMQLTRKIVHYLEFGVLPLAYTAPTENPFHNFVYETLVAVPKAIYEDSSLQSADSTEARRLRESRRPTGLQGA